MYIRALMANKGVAGTTRCRAGRQDAASRQASSRLLRCAPALRVTRPNVLTHRVFMAGSELPATSRPICENTSSPEVNPHILCSPFIRGFSQPPTDTKRIAISTARTNSYGAPASLAAARRRGLPLRCSPATAIPRAPARRQTSCRGPGQTPAGPAPEACRASYRASPFRFAPSMKLSISSSISTWNFRMPNNSTQVIRSLSRMPSRKAA